METIKLAPKIDKHSPFTPGVPAPPEMFMGRSDEIEMIGRCLTQAQNGKPSYALVKGDRGSGKSSLMNIVKQFTENTLDFLTVYVNLGSAESISDAIFGIVESMGTESYRKKRLRDYIKDLFGEKTFSVELLGLNISLNKKEAEKKYTHTNFIQFLINFVSEIQKRDLAGLLLIIDDINGVAKDKRFAGFIKSIADTIAINLQEFKFCLTLCATYDKWNVLVESHESVPRIFLPIELSPMSQDEVEKFYERAFSKVNLTFDKGVISLMANYCQGYPALVQELGDAVFWSDNDGSINQDDVVRGLRDAANRIGQKYLDDQVLKAIKSKRYNLILQSMAKNNISYSFTKQQLRNASTQTDVSESDITNFLSKMKGMNVFKTGETRGEYEFVNFFYYIYMMFFKPPK